MSAFLILYSSGSTILLPSFDRDSPEAPGCAGTRLPIEARAHRQRYAEHRLRGHERWGSLCVTQKVPIKKAWPVGQVGIPKMGGPGWKGPKPAVRLFWWLVSTHNPGGEKWGLGFSP